MNNKKLQKELALALVESTNKQKQAESNNIWFALILVALGLIAFLFQ